MKPLLFTLFNHFYKDGENKNFKFFQPVSLVALTLAMIVGTLLFYSYFLATGLKIRSFKLMMYLLLFVFYIGGYYFFVSKKGFEQLYLECKEKYSQENLKKFKYYTVFFYCILFLIVFYLAMHMNGQSIFDIPWRA